MAAPRKKVHRKPVNLTLSAGLKAQVEDILVGPESMSSLAEELLIKEIAARKRGYGAMLSETGEESQPQDKKRKRV